MKNRFVRGQDSNRQPCADKLISCTNLSIRVVVVMVFCADVHVQCRSTCKCLHSTRLQKFAVFTWHNAYHVSHRAPTVLYERTRWFLRASVPSQEPPHITSVRSNLICFGKHCGVQKLFALKRKLTRQWKISDFEKATALPTDTPQENLKCLKPVLLLLETHWQQVRLQLALPSRMVRQASYRSLLASTFKIISELLSQQWNSKVRGKLWDCISPVTSARRVGLSSPNFAPGGRTCLKLTRRSSLLSCVAQILNAELISHMHRHYRTARIMSRGKTGMQWGEWLVTRAWRAAFRCQATKCHFKTSRVNIHFSQWLILLAGSSFLADEEPS